MPRSKEEIGSLIQDIDQGIVHLLSDRLRLVLEIEQIKRENGDPIYRKNIENARILDIQDFAKSPRYISISPRFPTFIVTLFRLIMAESCREQMIQRENQKPKDK